MVRLLSGEYTLEKPGENTSSVLYAMAGLVDSTRVRHPLASESLLVQVSAKISYLRFRCTRWFARRICISGQAAKL